MLSSPDCKSFGGDMTYRRAAPQLDWLLPELRTEHQYSHSQWPACNEPGCRLDRILFYWLSSPLYFSIYRSVSQSGNAFDGHVIVSIDELAHRENGMHIAHLLVT